MGDEGWGGGGACFSLLTPSVCAVFSIGLSAKTNDKRQHGFFEASSKIKSKKIKIRLFIHLPKLINITI